MQGLFGVALLFQVAQGLRVTGSAKTVSVVPKAKDWLGWGRWVARGDYWHMQNPFGESLFNRDMPDECYTEIECRDANSFQSQTFNSVETWSEFYSFNLGLSIGGDINGISGSIEASLGIKIWKLRERVEALLIRQSDESAKVLQTCARWALRVQQVQLADTIPREGCCASPERLQC